MRSTHHYSISAIQNYVASGDYRSLRKSLQAMLPHDLKSILKRKFDNKSLLFLAAEQWVEVQRKKINAHPDENEQIEIKLYEYATVIRTLVAYGAQDSKAADFLYKDYQYSLMDDDRIDSQRRCDLLNELNHTIGDYIGEDDYKTLRAVCETIKSFNNEQDLINYYKLITQKDILPILGQDNYKTIINAYDGMRAHLKEINSPNYINKLEQLIDSPKNSLIFSKDWDMSRGSFLPYLSECGCYFFNRQRNKRRQQLERKIIQETITVYPPESTPNLNYLSLGFGEGLEDFISVGRLIKSGYKSIKVVLIDPSLDVNTIRHFKELNQLAIKYNVDLQVSHYKSVQEFQSSDCVDRMHIISAIDFEDIFKSAVFNDVVSAHQLLADKGRFYFSFTEHDICFSKTACLSYTSQNKNNPFIKNPKKYLEQIGLMDTDKLNYASLGLPFNFSEWMELIPLLGNTGCKEISITMIHPKEIGYFDNVKDKNNSHLNEANLRYLFKLLLPRESNVEVKMFESFEQFRNEFDKQPENKFHIVTLIGHFVSSPDEAEDINDWLQTKMANSIRLYNAYGPRTNQGENPIVDESYHLQSSTSYRPALI